MDIISKTYYLKYADCHWSEKAIGFYKTHFDELYVNDWKGDVWFTPKALLGPYLRTKNQITAIIEVGDSIFNNQSLADIKYALLNKISQNINERCIMHDCDCLANYGVLEPRLNAWRGFCRQWSLGDFPDLFFECVRQWYGLPPSEGKVLGIIGDTERKTLDEYESWFIKSFGSRNNPEVGWESFTKKMLLYGSYIKNNYDVEPLLNHAIGEPFEGRYDRNASIIAGTVAEIKRNGKCSSDELARELSKIDDISLCIKKIYTILDNRADSCYRKHKEVVQ